LNALFTRHSSKNCKVTFIFFFYLSSTINPFLYAARNRAFREEFKILLRWWKVTRITTEADSGANQKRGRGEKTTTETTIPFPDSSSVSSSGDGKQRDHRSPENEVEETAL